MCGGLSYPQARLTTETAWKAGGIRVNMLTRRFAFVPPYIGRMAKNFRADLGV